MAEGSCKVVEKFASGPGRISSSQRRRLVRQANLVKWGLYYSLTIKRTID